MEEPVDLADPQVWLRLADDKLVVVRDLCDHQHYDDAISRAYYAMYYAAKAALLSVGLDLRKHSSAVAKFQELFVQTGRVEPEYVRYLGRAQGARERSDYAPVISASEADAQEMLLTAEAFISKMKEVVRLGNS